MSLNDRSDTTHHGIFRFVQEQTGPFTVGALLKRAKRDNLGPTDIGSLIQNLEATGLVFPYSADEYTPRWAFFEGGRFIISLTEREIAENVLVPGHRFMPFVHPELDPAALALVSDDDSNSLETQTYLLPFEEALQFHTLYGIENLTTIFAGMDPRNGSLVRSPDPREEKVILKAYDLSPLGDNLRENASLLLRIRDWREGVLSVTILDDDERRRHPIQAQDWIAHLDRGFDRCFNYLGLTPRIAEQLAYAYFFAGPMVLKNPPMSFARYLEQSDFVDFLRYGGSTRLWRRDEEISDEIFTAVPEGSLSEDDPLEELLDEISHPFTAVMVEALLRNAVATDTEGLEDILESFFSPPYVEFDSEGQADALMSEIRGRYEELQSSFDPLTDTPKVPLRERILDLVLSLATWIDEAEELQQLDQVGPETEARELRVAVERAESFLRVLNDIKEIPTDLLADLVSELEKIEAVIETNQHVIDRYLVTGVYLDRHRPSGSEPGYRLTRIGEATSVYQLRMSLQGVEPEIWRRFLIPDNYTLEALHVVVQESMDWTNSHLHELYAAGSSYGVPEFDSEMARNLLPEANYTLASVFGDEGRATYVYDLSDEWRHIIQVERRLPVENAAMLLRDGLAPRCIGGEFRGPPEDAGGPDGFQTMLAESKLPAGYDPENFDEEVVNARLAEIEKNG